MNYSMNQIHDALFKSYLGKQDVLLEKAEKSTSFTMKDDALIMSQIIQSIQPKIDDMKLGGHHDHSFEKELYDQIGTYEDFHTAVRDGHAACLFVDLTDFTTRTFNEDIHQIVMLKRGAIQIWMALALLNDGHIHSITGDGLMVLFPRHESDPLENALRAYATGYNLLNSMEQINEKFGLVGRDRLRIKVGLDYCDQLVWNVCGLLTTNKECRAEVKATGFGIDFSAKLMGYTSAIIRNNTSIQHNEVLLFGEKAFEILALRQEFVNEYKSAVDERPVAPYKRTKGDETKLYKIQYSDTKKLYSELQKSFVTYEDIALLLESKDEEPIYELPEKSDVMYA